MTHIDIETMNIFNVRSKTGRKPVKSAVRRPTELKEITEKLKENRWSVLRLWRQSDGCGAVCGGKDFWKRFESGSTVWVTDGDSGDDGKDELTWLGWEECEGEWLGRGLPNEAGS